MSLSAVVIKSACGRKETLVDPEDVPLNPHGVECCSECKTIIASREAWESEYSK